MLNDMREVIAAALVASGHSPESTDPQHLAQAQALLQQQKPFLAKYDSESFEDSLASGETVLAQGWSGEIAMAQAQNPDIAFVVPADGTFVFVDNWAIPKGCAAKRVGRGFYGFCAAAGDQRHDRQPRAIRQRQRGRQILGQT